jgi:hypothetical protein
MRLRVVGGPIRRTDRIVLDVTSNTTFEAILALIFKKVESLDLADMAKDYFNTSSSSPTRVPESDAFGDTVQESDDSTASSSGGEGGGRPNALKKKKSYTLPRALSTRTVAGVTPCAGSVAPNRLACPPLDFTHFHIALLEFGPDDKPFATRLCKKADTPRSVHMRIPVIGLFLRKEFKAMAGSAETGNMTLPGGIESPHDEALMPSAVSPPDVPRGESPLVRLASPQLPQHPGDGACLSNAKDMSLSRPLSFALHYSTTTFPPTTALQRALALFGVSRNDGVNTARVQRILQKVGQGRHEVFLATAENALLGHDHAYHRSASEGNVADAPIGMHFAMQNIKDVLAMCLVKLDCGTPYNTAYESATILADMLVHAAPVGEELLYASVFLGFQLSDYHERLRTTGKIIDLSTAQWINFSPPSSLATQLEQLAFLEATHRAVLQQHELRSLEWSERTLLMMHFYQCSFQPVSTSRRGSYDTTPFRPSTTSYLSSIGPPVVADDLVWERLAHYLSHELLATSPVSGKRTAASRQATPRPIITSQSGESDDSTLLREVAVTKPVFTPQRTATAKLVLDAPTASKSKTSAQNHRDPSSFTFSAERPPKAVPSGSASTPGGDSCTSFSIAAHSPTAASGEGSPATVAGRIGTLERDVAQVKEALAQQTLLLQRLLERGQ